MIDDLNINIIKSAIDKTTILVANKKNAELPKLNVQFCLFATGILALFMVL